MPMNIFTTFSVVAYDAVTKSWGVAVQSKFFAVGVVVPCAQAGAGVIATQAQGSPASGKLGLQLLTAGKTAEQVIDELLHDDPSRDNRQFGVVDQLGNVAAFTGKQCIEVAEHYIGDGFACQGNMLAPGVIDAMASAFQRKREHSEELADWLMASLNAGQDAGGDRRGEQAAALLVVRENGGLGGEGDRMIDLRVDDHHTPIDELSRLLALHRLFLAPPRREDFVPFEGVAAAFRSILAAFGHAHPAESVETEQECLVRLLARENLLHLFDKPQNRIDARLINYFTKKN